MFAYGIQGAKRRGKPWRTTTPDPDAARRPDLVERDFTATGPDRLYVADFTYLRCWEGLLFFAFVIDVYSRRVVGWQLTAHMRASLVCDALRMAVCTRPRHGADVKLIHHSDVGIGERRFDHVDRAEWKRAIHRPRSSPTRITASPTTTAARSRTQPRSAYKASVAEVVYRPGAAPPAAPAPSSEPAAENEETVPPFTINEAQRYVGDVLKAKYGKRLRQEHLTRACSRPSVEKVRCQVAWRKKPYKHSGRVDMWNDPDDATSLASAVSVARKRISAPAKRRSASSPAKPACNRNHTGVCLQLHGDVNCGDISAPDFRSIGTDPFRLDGDGDGIACES